ncbi:MAG: TM0106 family RecB-like putative nuclease [Oscillatoriaceae bacterium SKW80]|nr:TM0106 family RecB-like putative nuclease [Oscillatoriaceae bacterium SKYG93]MCX8120259.1 TM0106 family RecB-like putative nuclease [Oscillatoriaceae bacterium SKW80]MDW8453185.1 TM0106 family RecB-like putative nuclease [Oscillatoriaceae cyanobacterium SKYGB_i_bin93]HIK28903.1 TM0106 family RecB-like putative nuclease [Oscillatoriaceae cyanobacterium M7585_C2015_266]
MLLTTELLFYYQRCQRRTFLDVFANPYERARPSDFLVKLQQDIWAYKQAIVAAQGYSQPNYTKDDWLAGAKATLELMQQGAERIYQGVLLAEGLENVSLVGTPDLLVKESGTSCFGDWMYFPLDIKLGKRPKLDYQLIVAYHALLLAFLQGVLPSKALLLLRDKGEYSVNLSQRVPEVKKLASACIQMLKEQREPEVFISRHPCSLCHWYSSCYALAKSERHISLLPGVTANRYTLLRKLNLTTIEALAAADPTKLEIYPEFANKGAQQLVLQARAFLENRALATPEAFCLSVNDLPVSSVELYFDIEAEPELNLNYLYGVLVVDRQNNTEKFYPFLAEKPEDEKVAWEQFLQFVCQYPLAPIFHFCEYEVQTVKRLAKRYYTPSHWWKPVLKRFTDVHALVTRSVVMPVESYALKSLARWMGFEWRNFNADGAQCVIWYERWLATSDRSFLELILRYNEDDCRATYIVKDWLYNFLKTMQ